MRDNDSQKIIVVGIPKTMDDAGLSELFSSFGTVAEAKVVLDVNNKQPRGFGFVTFTSGAAMRSAIQAMNKKVVDGRTLNVRQLVPKDKFKAEKAKDETAQDAASRPCWLLRKGKCTKGDLCPFSHETKNGEFGSCFEFMQTGECKRGDKCIFSHKIADAAASGDSATPTETASSSKDTKVSAPAPRTDAKPATAAADGEPKKRVCYAFQKGKCHRGKKCLFLHEKVPEMANDQPVSVTKAPAAAAVARGEFEVVTQAADSKKRSRVDSHDDDDEDEDDETALAAMKPSAAKKPQLSQTKAAALADKKSAVSATRPAAAAPQSRDRAAAPPAAKASAPARPVKSEPQQTATATATILAAPVAKRPRDDDSSAETEPKKPFEKRPRFDPSTAGVDKPLHPAAKRISERELKRNGPSKYGDGQAIAQPKPKVKLNANDRFAKRAARNNKSALQRQKRKLRDAAGPQSGGGGDSNDKPVHEHAAPAKKRPAERVDMGAAFDGVSDDDRKPRSGRVVDKAQQKANREKAQRERKAKREAKKSALSRLQTQEKVEL